MFSTAGHQHCKRRDLLMNGIRLIQKQCMRMDDHNPVDTVANRVK